MNGKLFHVPVLEKKYHDPIAGEALLGILRKRDNWQNNLRDTG